MSDAAHRLHRELPKALELKRYLDENGFDDPDAILGTIEGETDLFEFIDALHEKLIEDGILVEGMKVHLDAMQKRKSRVEKSIEDGRNIILMAMDRLGVHGPVKRSTGTFTVRKVPGKLEIVQESEIPSQFWQAQDPKLDTKGLLAALKDAEKDSEEIPGARVGSDGIGLTIRVK